MKLVTATQAAKRMGVSRAYLGAMKIAGAPFWGNKTCVEDLAKWLRRTPTFVANHHRQRKPD